MKPFSAFIAYLFLSTSAQAQGPSFHVCVYDFCSREKVEDISVRLKPDQGMEQMTFTSDLECATFQVADIPIGTPMELSLTGEINTLSGISISDITRFEKYLSGEQPFTETYQWLAADVNRDHVIDSTDLVQLLNISIGNYSELPNNSSRLFFPVQFVFNHPEMPFLDTLPELPLTVIRGMTTYAGFYTVVLGDLDRSECLTTAAHEQPGSLTTQIFPNPVSEVLQIRIPESLDVQKIILTDALGKLVLTTSGTEIPVKHLPNGMYVLKISSGDRHVFVSRIQVVH